MWLVCPLQFRMRTGKETHDIKLHDFDLRSDDNGAVLTEFTYRIKSNGCTENQALSVCCSQDRDTVTLYKKTRSTARWKCWTLTHFFLSINYAYKSGKAWYKITPMRINKMYSIRISLFSHTSCMTNQMV